MSVSGGGGEEEKIAQHFDTSFRSAFLTPRTNHECIFLPLLGDKKNLLMGDRENWSHNDFAGIFFGRDLMDSGHNSIFHLDLSLSRVGFSLNEEFVSRICKDRTRVIVKKSGGFHNHRRRKRCLFFRFFFSHEKNPLLFFQWRPYERTFFLCRLIKFFRVKKSAERTCEIGAFFFFFRFGKSCMAFSCRKSHS